MESVLWLIAVKSCSVAPCIMQSTWWVIATNSPLNSLLSTVSLMAHCNMHGACLLAYCNK